ncbi:MAG: hypothetical protein ABW208_25775 [Pyrinomonadaceae bacterium]
MNRPDPPRGGEHTQAGDTEGSLGVPIRRSRWVSFWIGVGAVVLSLLTAAALTGLLLLLPTAIDGAWVVLFFASLLFGLFFLSLPRQKRYARTFDLRRPGARFDGGLLTVTLADDTLMRFDLSEPHELTRGWFEVITHGGGGPTTNTRGLMTYALLSQAGQELCLQAEDSVREAQTAGWPNRTIVKTPERRVRLWASDLVTLIEAVRTHAPWFSHGHHLSRFAARALLEERPETAQAAFAAWAAVEPAEVLFPTREFADAAYELNLEPEKAAPLIPEINRHAFFTHYQTRVDPGYNPWSY